MDGFSSIGGGITACLNASIKIFEITYQLKAVEQQTSDLLSTTRLVDHDVKEARRLRRLKLAFLSASERAWMDGVIDHTESALRAVAQLIEPARVDKTTNQGINFGNRVMWVFKNNPQVRDRHQRLVLCHQSLTTIISCLYSKDAGGTAPMADDNTEEQPPSYDSKLHEFLSWRHRKRSHTDLIEGENKATGSPSSTNSSSIPNTEVSQSSASSLSNPDGLSPRASLTKDMSKPYATVPGQQIPSPTSNRFESEEEYFNNSPVFGLPASSQTPNRQWHNDKTGKYGPENEVSNTAPTLDIHLQDKDSIFRWTLPEIDMSSFAGMISDKVFHSDGHDHQIYDAYSTQHDAMHQDQEIKRLATPFAGTTSPTTAASAPNLPYFHPPPELSSGSTSIPTTGQNRGYDWPKPPGRYRYSQPELWTATQAIHQPPPTPRVERDDQGPTVQPRYRPDAALRVPSPAYREDTPPIAVQRTSTRRGGRDWLAYQATRSELEHNMGSDGQA